MISGILTGILFGFILAAPPGPVNAIIAEESIKNGWVSGLEAGLGAMVSDAFLLSLSYAGVIAIVIAMEWLRGVIIGAGGMLMLFFAYRMFVDWKNEIEWEVKTNDKKGFFKTLIMGLTNPYQMTFWIGISAGLLQINGMETVIELPIEIAETVTHIKSTEIIIGIFIGIFIWIIVFPIVLTRLGKEYKSMPKIISLTGSIILFVFGAIFLIKSASVLLGV